MNNDGKRDTKELNDECSVLIEEKESFEIKQDTVNRNRAIHLESDSNSTIEFNDQKKLSDNKNGSSDSDDEKCRICELCECDFTDELCYSLSALYKAFSEENRLRIIFLLLHKELCVLDIATRLNMTQSNVSHQLRTLRQMRIVKLRKEKKNSYYSLDDKHIEDILTIGYHHVSHIKGGQI